LRNGTRQDTNTPAKTGGPMKYKIQKIQEKKRWLVCVGCINRVWNVHAPVLRKESRLCHAYCQQLQPGFVYTIPARAN